MELRVCKRPQQLCCGESPQQKDTIYPGPERGNGASIPEHMTSAKSLPPLFQEEHVKDLFLSNPGDAEDDWAKLPAMGFSCSFRQ